MHKKGVLNLKLSNDMPDEICFSLVVTSNPIGGYAATIQREDALFGETLKIDSDVDTMPYEIGRMVEEYIDAQILHKYAIYE